MYKTAADFLRLAHQDQIPLIFKLRQASMDPQMSQAWRRMYRVAAKYLWATLLPGLDLLARLQVLEGVAGLVRPGSGVQGPWSKDPRRGLRAAVDFFQNDGLDPQWFIPGDTGFLNRIFGAVRMVMEKYTRGRESFVDPEDLLMNGLTGRTKDGVGTLSSGPLLNHFGATYKPLKSMLFSGTTPQNLAGIAAKNFVQKVGDQFLMTDRSRTDTETPQGTSVFDLLPTRESDTSFTDFLQALMQTSQGASLVRKMRELAGTNIVANEIIDRLVKGEPIGSASRVHKDLGFSGSGAAVAWTKDRFFPAVAEYVQEDSELNALFRQTTGRRARRQR